MKIIRWFLGNIILFVDAITAPSGMKRAPEAQKAIDTEVGNTFVLYELKMCPFCVKVRRAAKRYSLTIPQKDVGIDASAQAELMAGGKKDQVPCLRITSPNGSVEWMYESSEIVAYFEKRFGQSISA